MSRDRIAGRTDRKAGRGRTGLGWRGRLSALLLFTCATWMLASPARAYVRYQVLNADGLPTGVYFQWKQTCVPVVVYPNDISSEMSVDQVEQAVSAAAAAWSTPQVSCTFLDIQVSASFDTAPAASSDGYNIVAFRNPWCDPAEPPSACQMEALAITTVWAGKTSGTVQGADIEVNAQYDVWADLETAPVPGRQDLQNAITHEMGHLIGLDHNCHQTSDPFQMTDNTGAIVPDCTTAPADVQADTMFAISNPGDLTKRTLAPDDIQAVCDIYPSAQNPNYCPGPGQLPPTPSEGCRCALEPTTGAPAAMIPALTLLVALVVRRRSRR